MHKPALIVHLVFHPESDLGRTLALHVHSALNKDPVLPGLRIPTVFCAESDDLTPPTGLDLDDAELSFVVVLADTDINADDDWCEFVADVWEACVGTRHRCVPFQITEDAWPLSPERLGEVNFPRAYHVDDAQKPDLVARRVVLELCRCLHGDAIGGEHPEAPTKLFVSHAKTDIDAEPKVAQSLIDFLGGDQPIATWFDSGQIAGGSLFTKKIEEGITDSSLLCVLTTHYASREWCRREVILAKQRQRPIVVVDAIEDTEQRSFPYLGNLPVIRWQNDPQAIIDLVMKETLRDLHTRLLLKAWRKNGDTVFTRPPELATLLDVPDGHTVLYPDPPLGVEEVRLLEKTQVTVTTPLQRLAADRPLQGQRLALSMSESTDNRRFGADTLHQEQAMLELSRYLLILGATLAYGGHLGSEGYTVQLAELVRSHNAIEGVDPVNRIVNYLAWPIPFDKKQKAAYKYTARIERVARPGGIDESLDPDFSAGPDQFFPATQSPQHRYAWARGMTAMRERETRETVARLVMGGTFGPTDKRMADGTLTKSWYASRIPGLLEEVMCSVEEGQPVFLLGAFGGVAALVIDILEGRPRPEMSWDYQKDAPHAAQMRDLYRQRGERWQDYPEMIERLREVGVAGINPLLSEEEHRVLFRARDPYQMTEIVLRGLGRI